jgi:hypothetical protein
MDTTPPIPADERWRLAFIKDLVLDIKKWKAISRDEGKPATAALAKSLWYRLYASFRIFEEESSPSIKAEISTEYPNLDAEMIELLQCLGELGEFRTGLAAYELISREGHPTATAMERVTDGARVFKTGAPVKLSTWLPALDERRTKKSSWQQLANRFCPEKHKHEPKCGQNARKNILKLNEIVVRYEDDAFARGQFGK